MLLKGEDRVIAEIPTTHITEGQVERLITTLFAVHTLTDDEIVDSHVRANTKQYRNLLSVQWHRSQPPISVIVSDGSNWVHAGVIPSVK